MNPPKHDDKRITLRMANDTVETLEQARSLMWEQIGAQSSLGIRLEGREKKWRPVSLTGMVSLAVLDFCQRWQREGRTVAEDLVAMGKFQREICLTCALEELPSAEPEPGLNMSLTDDVLVFAIGASGPFALKDVQAKVGGTKSAVSHALRRWVDRGWLTRVGAQSGGKTNAYRCVAHERSAELPFPLCRRCGNNSVETEEPEGSGDE